MRAGMSSKELPVHPRSHEMKPMMSFPGAQRNVIFVWVHVPFFTQRQPCHIT